MSVSRETTACVIERCYAPATWSAWFREWLCYEHEQTFDGAFLWRRRGEQWSLFPPEDYAKSAEKE